MELQARVGNEDLVLVLSVLGEFVLEALGVGGESGGKSGGGGESGGTERASTLGFTAINLLLLSLREKVSRGFGVGRKRRDVREPFLRPLLREADP